MGGEIGLRAGLASMFYSAPWGYNPLDAAATDTAVSHMAVSCCRRDSAALQLLVCAEDDLLLDVSGNPLLWKGGDRTVVRAAVELEGAAEAGIRIETKLVGLVEDYDRIRRPDPLLDAASIEVEKGRIQQVWIECHVGKHTPPGDYRGVVRAFARRMFGDETVAAYCTFSLRVHPETLPESREYSFYLDLWQHNANIARKHDVPLWSDDHLAIIDRYMESLVALGQKAVSVIVSDAPWCGQRSYRDGEPSDLFEYGIVAVTKGRDGRFEYDFSVLERYLSMAERRGMAEEIELFGLLGLWESPDAPALYRSLVEGYPDAMRVRYYDRATGVYRYIRGRAELEAYISALYGFFVSTGRAARVRVLADEPSDAARLERQLATLRRLAPSFRYKIALDHAEFIGRQLPDVTDYAPILGCVARQYEELQALKRSIPGRLLFYVCSGPKRPNTFLSSPPIECRLLPWLVEVFGYDGFLRWSYTAWPDRPLERPYYRPTRWETGDLFLVYPGRNGAPISSLRYKRLQRGIRDYELMQLLKRTGRAELVAEALRRVIRYDHPVELLSASGKKAEELYSLNPEDYELIRS